MTPSTDDGQVSKSKLGGVWRYLRNRRRTKPPHHRNNSQGESVARAHSMYVGSVSYVYYGPVIPGLR